MRSANRLWSLEEVPQSPITRNANSRSWPPTARLLASAAPVTPRRNARRESLVFGIIDRLQRRRRGFAGARAAGRE